MAESSSGASTPARRRTPVGSTGGTDEGSDGEVNWKEKYQTLETSLQKFKIRAAQIREMLATKMEELNKRTEEAEERASKAVEKNKKLEDQLAASNWKPAETDKRIHELETELRSKEKVITELHTQMHQLNVLRTQEAKIVEEKSSKIKEWVTKKLKELEVTNGQYKLENETLRDQVEILRARLNSLPIATAREVYRVSVQTADSSRTSSRADSLDLLPPEIPKRPSSYVLESFRRERDLDPEDILVRQLHGENLILAGNHIGLDQHLDMVDNVLDNPIDEDDEDFDPVYQEIDDNHESKYEPKRMAPPQVRIERKVFPNPTMCSSMISSTTGSEEMLDGERHHHMFMPHSTGRTEPRVEGGQMVAPSCSSMARDSPYGEASLPKTPCTPQTPFLPEVPPPNSQTPICPYSHPYGNHQTVSALATMPRRKKDNKLQIGDFKPMSHGRHCPGTKDDTSTIPYEHIGGGRYGRMKPPTPPMRRLPSWENRIYAIANAGMKLPDPGPFDRESSYPVTDGLYTDHMYRDLSVPVYTTLKGKAAQIRSTPFTGDSTDSSDNEDTGVTMTPSEPEAAITVAGPSRAKTTNTVTIRKQLNHSSSGATKRGVSSHSRESIVSDTSSDYAVPPDEVSIQTDSSDNSEPEQKLLKYTTEHLRKDSLEKCGYLTKLGGKVKNWKRRWFVLKNGEMLYYKSPNDVARKPQGYISLDGQTRITKTEGAHTFQITTIKKTYYLTADNKEEMDHWIRVLQNVLKKAAADQVLGQTRAKEVMKGWLIKTKHGRSRRCWCVLMGKFFMYYKSPNDKTPLGQIHLRDARIEEVDRSCDSETDSDDTTIPDYTLGIYPTLQAPTYLMIATKQEKDSWLYHLTVAAGGGTGNVGSEYEQIISKLMEMDGDPTSIYWKHPILLHTKDALTGPLTTLPSEDLQSRAIALFKSCHMFCNMAIDSPQIDYHVSLTQTIMDVCLQHPELQNELYCQLIRQTSRHPPQHKSGMQNFLLCGSSSWFLCDASPTSPTSSVMDLTDSKLNPVGYVFIQGWQLLSSSVSLFLPKQSILWYLKAHLQRNADPRTEMGKYAVFCQRALDRSMHNGGREARPSRMEVLSILLRNPYHHSQPISIPVHFLNGTYQVVSFDGSTTVQEFLQSLNKAINMRDCALSGFSLFTDDPAGQELEHCLKGHLKLCDVISKWEQAFFHHHSKRGRPDTNRTVKLTYKNRLYFKSLVRTETEKERLLLTYQTSDEIVNGRFPLNRDLAIELAALMAQIEHGDFRTVGEALSMSPAGGRLTPPHSQQQLPTVIERFYPKRYRDIDQIDMRVLERKIQDKWCNLKGRTVQDCVRIYLTVARKWLFFGAKLFTARIKFGDLVNQVWIAIQEDAISVLDYATLKPLNTYDYQDVVTFGGCRDDFMLVVTLPPEGATAASIQHARTERVIFCMNKPKILEVTMLMASYINSRGQHKNVVHVRSDATRGCLTSMHTASVVSKATTTNMET